MNNMKFRISGSDFHVFLLCSPRSSPSRASASPSPPGRASSASRRPSRVSSPPRSPSTPFLITHNSHPDSDTMGHRLPGSAGFQPAASSRKRRYERRPRARMPAIPGRARPWQAHRTGMRIVRNQDTLCPGLIDASRLRLVAAQSEEAMSELARDIPLGHVGRPEDVASRSSRSSFPRAAATSPAPPSPPTVASTRPSSEELQRPPVL